MESLVQDEKQYKEELEWFQQATNAIVELQEAIAELEEKRSMTSKMMLEVIEEMLSRK